MAGGVGERFWPRSRKRSPKQLLEIATQKCLLEETIDRIQSSASKEYVRIVTNAEQSQLVLKKIPSLGMQNILIEPAGMNTAPCIALALAAIPEASDEDVMVVLPADHIIHDIEKFNQQIRACAEHVHKNNCLLTIGIKPHFPSTGYGYIQRGNQSKNDFYQVQRFVEKPDHKKATQYVESGEYFWNSGIFVWKFGTICDEFKKFMPDLYEHVQKIRSEKNQDIKHKMIWDMYANTQKISIDYGIMEKSKCVEVLPAEFDWDDLGAWDAYERHAKKDADGNVIEGQIVLVDVHNSIVLGQKKLIAMVGVENLMVVESDDAILICPKNKAQDVKSIVQSLKNHKLDSYL